MNAERRPERRPGAANTTIGGVGTSVRDIADVAREVERQRRRRLAADLSRVADRLDRHHPEAADLARLWAVEIGKPPTPADGHCCGALDADDLRAARRRGIACGPTSCVRRLLGHLS